MQLACQVGLPQSQFCSPFCRHDPAQSFGPGLLRARRDLVTKIFFAHYEPRLRDNEQRRAADRPLRGGPAAITNSTDE